MTRTLVVALVAACGGSSAQPDALIILHPDAATDASHDASTAVNNVEIQAFGGVPTLVAYRDGNSAWQTLTPDQTGYTLSFTDDYTFVMVCVDATGFDAEWIGGAASDGAQQTVYCAKNFQTGPTVAASGHMTQAGMVEMFDLASSTTANWDFTLNVPANAHDLVATDAGRIVIRRDVSITAATTMPTIDVVAEGSALVATPLTINGRTSGDRVSSAFELGMTHDYAVLQSTSATVQVPPASLLMASDFEYLIVEVSSATSVRTVATPFSASNTTFTLLHELTGVTFDTTGGAVSAAWTTLPDNIGTQLYTLAQGAQQGMVVTTAWLANHGSTHMGFDTSAPGYDDAWKIDLTGPYLRELLIEQASGNIGYTSGAYEDVNGATMRTPPGATARARALRALRPSCCRSR